MHRVGTAEYKEYQGSECYVCCARLCTGRFDKRNLRSKSAGTLDEVEVIDKTTDIRGKWDNRIEFVLSCVGFAVGLGNVWRFPIRVYESGGGAFLVPYTALCIALGVPLLLLELGIAQFSGRGPTKAFKMVPILYGIGWCMVFVAISILIYYSAIIAWSYFYLFASLTSVLPWSVCSHDFNTNKCLASLANKSALNSSIEYVSSTSEYWDYYVTGFIKYPSREPYNMNEYPGPPQWHLALCLLLTWSIAGLGLMFGVKVSGKIIYFTVLYPYFALLCLIILGCTLPGSANGIIFYLAPDWNKIYDPKVLRGAVEQLFFSCSIAQGGMITYSSYNDFHDNFYRDSIIVIFVDYFTSVIAGFAVFPILGYMAQRTGTKIENIINSGSSLFFITFTEALSTLPAPQFWTILLMLMAITLGMDSQFAMFETVVTALIDHYPFLQASRFLKAVTVWILCFLLFISGLLLVSPGGEFWFDILDKRVSSFGLPLIALSETICVGLIYGFKQFRYDFKMMAGFSLSLYWFIMMAFVSPIIIFGILLASFINFDRIKVRDLEVPIWAETLAFVFLLIVLLPIAIGIVHTIYKFKLRYNQLETKAFMKKLIEPPVYWGPYYKKNWLLGSFYRKKLLENYENPQFLKYVSKIEDVKGIVELAKTLNSQKSSN
uniref:Slc6a-23 n=1 Tax=Schmidtea mediterranea TaxID=79327 RepID=A0A0H3YK23_SCHMD|nr:slc6a-23 [Schmidtea mediterranea]